MKYTLLTFRPTFWRSYRLFLLPCLTSFLIAWLVDVVTRNAPFSITGLKERVILFAFLALGGLIGTLIRQNHLVITLSEEYVSGPSSWGWWRVDIPRSMLDHKHTCKHTLWQRVFGYRYLRSTEGHKIRVDTWTFDSEQITALLAELGCTTT